MARGSEAFIETRDNLRLAGNEVVGAGADIAEVRVLAMRLSRNEAAIAIQIKRDLVDQIAVAILASNRHCGEDTRAGKV